MIEVSKEDGDGKFTMTITQDESVPIIGANTVGCAALRGTYEQFRELYNTLGEAFEFEGVEI